MKNPALKSLRIVGTLALTIGLSACNEPEMGSFYEQPVSSLFSMPSQARTGLFALDTTRYNVSLTINSSRVSANVSTTDNSQIKITASINSDLFNQSGSSNSISLQIFYPCGQNSENIQLVSVDRQFTYNDNGSVSIFASDATYPNLDGDSYSNMYECANSTLAYDADHPDGPPPQFGDISFAVGFKADTFYDSDTNDAHNRAFHANNDTLSEAQTIGGNSKVYGYANSLTDRVDYFIIPGVGIGDVHLNATSGGSDLDLLVTDVNGTEFVSAGTGAGPESISGAQLPVTIIVTNYANQNSFGSRYELTTSFPTAGSTPSATAVRMRVNLIDPATGDKLWGDDVYTRTQLATSPGTTYFELFNVPVGNYNYELASNMDIDDDPQGDVHFSTGATGSGNITAVAGEKIVRSVILE